MPVQRTLILIKPDALQRALAGEILARFERKGLRPVGMKLTVPSAATAAAHYAEHQGKPFFPELISFLTSGPLVAIALEGDQAVTVCRTLIGPTDGRLAPPGTLRGDFGLAKAKNLVHGSDSPEAATRELAIWFPEGLLDWQRCDTAWAESL
jgi:nucleoside-diphosphate kinase